MALHLHQFHVAAKNEGGVHRRQSCDKKIYVSVNIFLWKFEAFSGKTFSIFCFQFKYLRKKFFTCESFNEKCCAAFLFYFFFVNPLRCNHFSRWKQKFLWTESFCTLSDAFNKFLIGFFINWSSLINYITCQILQRIFFTPKILFLHSKKTFQEMIPC